MSAKPINEYSGKELLYRSLEHVKALCKPKAVKLDEESKFNDAIQNCEWLKIEKKGVIKPDQLIKRRGKHSLVKIGSTDELGKWFDEKKGKYIQIEKTNGRLSHFILEPFVEHSQKDELYLAIYSQMYNDVIMFFEEGGIDIGDVDQKARKLLVPVKENDNEMNLNDKDLNELLGKNLDDSKKSLVFQFIKELYEVYKKNHFTYLEINPLVVCNGKIYILDLAAKLDETAAFLCSELWKTRDGESIDFPAPFGRDLAKEEK
jgi:ATP citrate (pro-S)-lyase